MGHQRVRAVLQGLAGVVACAFVLTLVGCSGGAGGLGAAEGYVSQPIGGGAFIVAGTNWHPTGYEPVAGAVVFIEGHPELTATTDANGYYFIDNIPAGWRTLVVRIVGLPDVRFTIPIIAGHTTKGLGHEEGGG